MTVGVGGGGAIVAIDRVGPLAHATVQSAAIKTTADRPKRGRAWLGRA